MPSKYKSPPVDAVTKTKLPYPHPETSGDWFHYDYHGEEGGGLLLTGPVNGTIILKDGTVYDVSPETIPHFKGHAGPIVHHIESIHEAAGRAFDYERDEDGNTKYDEDGNTIPIPFVHVCHTSNGDPDDESDSCACGNEGCKLNCGDEADDE